MVLAELSVMWYYRFRRIHISYFVSVDAGPDHLKVYVYSQSMNVISWFTLFKLFRYLKWNTDVWVCNTTTRVLLALSTWTWCTGWCFLFLCNCALLMIAYYYKQKYLQKLQDQVLPWTQFFHAALQYWGSTCGTEAWARWSWQLLPSNHHQPCGWEMAFLELLQGG